MKKYLLVFVVLAVAIAVIIYVAKLFSPGSYPHAEEYELPVDEATLITIIQKFKEENPQYQVPAQTGLIDQRTGFNNLLYRVDFYYPEENQILFTWIRSAGKQKTTLAFVSVNDGLVLGNWKRINEDFSSSENAEQIKKFESRILNRVKQKIK